MWKTGWIRQVLGRSSRTVVGPNTSVTLNGPSRRGANFRDGYGSWICRESRKTLSPTWKHGTVDTGCLTIASAAWQCDAIVFSRASRSCLKRSSTAGYLASVRTLGIAGGLYPSKSSKGAFFVELCSRWRRSGRAQCLRQLAQGREQAPHP